MIHHLLGNHEYIELCDLLKHQRLCQTGGHAKLCISEREVTVNGHIETRKRYKTRAGDVVEFNGQMIRVEASPKD